MNERSLSARWRNVGVVSVVYAAASPRAPPLNEPPLSSERPLHGSWLSLLLAMLHWEKRTGSSGPAAEPGDSLPLLSLEGHGGGLGESLSDTPESFKMRLPKRMSAPRRDNVLRCGIGRGLLGESVPGPDFRDTDCTASWHTGCNEAESAADGFVLQAVRWLFKHSPALFLVSPRPPCLILFV